MPPQVLAEKLQAAFDEPELKDLYQEFLKKYKNLDPLPAIGIRRVGFIIRYFLLKDLLLVCEIQRLNLLCSFFVMWN